MGFSKIIIFLGGGGKSSCEMTPKRVPPPSLSLIPLSLIWLCPVKKDLCDTCALKVFQIFYR